MVNSLKTKHFVYLTLFFLTVVSVNFFSIFSAFGSINVSSSDQATNKHSTENTVVEIRKAVLLDAQKYNWKPQVTIEGIVDNYVIVESHDSYTGGESILEKKQGSWEVICGSGGVFTQLEQLVEGCKMSQSAAKHLLQERENNRDRGFDNLNN